MGTSKIWLHPYAFGSVTEVDFSETFSDLQPNPLPHAAISEGMTGQHARTQFNSRMMVRLVHERTTDAALVRSLYLIETHLKNGGIISAAVDSAAAWAGYTTVIPTRSATVLSVHSQMWPYEAAPGFDTGAELELMSSQPYCRREFVTNDGAAITASNGPVTVSALEFAYREEPDVRWCLLRHRGFWPALRLPKDAIGNPIVTHDHQLSYTFDAQLEEAIDVLDALAAVPTETTTTTEVSGSRTNNQVTANENMRPIQTGFGPMVP